MPGVRAVITIAAEAADADQIEVSIRFDPPADRRHPSVVDRAAATALDAILGAAKQGAVLEVDTLKGGTAGVKHAGR